MPRPSRGSEPGWSQFEMGMSGRLGTAAEAGPGLRMTDAAAATASTPKESRRMTDVSARAGPRLSHGQARRRFGAAPTSRGVGPSDRYRHQAAAATMAALSVHSSRL